jgi:hypothetical protein
MPQHPHSLNPDGRHNHHRRPADLVRAFAKTHWGCGSAAMVVMFLCWPMRAAAGDGTFPPLLYAAEGAKQIIEYDRDGKVVWEYPAEMSRDVWRLPNGNMLFCFNRDYDAQRNDGSSGVMEVSPDKTVVWQFATTGQVWSCQRLADGNTLVGAASQGKLLIVNPTGQIVNAITLLNKPGHSCIRNARQIPNGNFLVAEEGARAVREYSAAGKLVREIKVGFAPYSAVRLDNGNTMICGQQSMLEVDTADNIIWSLQGAEIPAMGIRWFAGIQMLPNGNIFICNAGGKVPFLEVSRAKKVVWQSGPGQPPFPLGHGVQRLDVTGRADK